MRLRRSDPSRPGISRRRYGRSFGYVGADGNRIRDRETLGRAAALVLPPAWTEVWICPWPNGHLQAIGTDAAGRRRYRYHDEWRRQRDRVKDERVIAFAEALPAARAQSPSSSPFPACRESGCWPARSGCSTGLLPDRQRGVRRRARHLRAGYRPTGARQLRGSGDLVPVHRQRRHRPAATDQRRRGPGRGGRVEATPRRRAGTPCLPRPPGLARPQKREHQPLPEDHHRRRVHRQGFPDLERHRDGRRVPGGRGAGRAEPDVEQARGGGRDPRGCRLPRQHPGGVPPVLHSTRGWWSTTTTG